MVVFEEPHIITVCGFSNIGCRPTMPQRRSPSTCGCKPGGWLRGRWEVWSQHREGLQIESVFGDVEDEEAGV